MSILSFSEAIEHSKGTSGNTHLLLGNGFSIACRKDAFSYGRLFDEADFSALAVSPESLFELAGTADFERAIEALRVAAYVVGIYPDHDEGLPVRIKEDADALKSILAEVLARKHPENVGSIADAEYANARGFLANFNGSLYTVSYDLLLYWTLLQDVEPAIESNDGFLADPDDPDAEWVIWNGFDGATKQRVFFLHGGLHLFDAGSSLRKLTWVRTGVPLIDQIRDALDQDLYPHVVTEGSSEEKLARIEHSPYMHRGLKSLNSCGGSLFVYGHSLDPNDEHVLQRIERSKIESLYVSLHGDPDSETNQMIRARASLAAEHRDAYEAGKPANRKKSLGVIFYEADSAKIWTS